MKSKHLVAFFVIGALAFVEVAVLRSVDIRVAGGAGGSADPTPVAAQPAPPYDVTALIRPADKKYLGVTVKGGADMERVGAFAERIGKKPNLVAVFESFDDDFAASEVRKIHGYGALPVIRWEPFDIPLRDIAAGKHDDYVKKFATAVRVLNLPIALTFAHEMNGHWYSWGTEKNKPAEFVAAWRHLHAIFQQQGATNVLWTWTPNVINYLRNTKLGPLYPGDAYVDWVGMDGYYTLRGPNTFGDLFRPTISAVRKLTRKPIVIVETGVEPSSSRPGQIKDLLTSVAASKDVIGVMYFDINGSGRWNIDKDDSSLRAFARQAERDAFGFDVRDLK